MELKHLRAFVALAEELHFSRAALRLHIVQPALSAQIRALEESVGARLFERDRHHVALTDEGRLMLPEALATLRQAARTREVVKRAHEGEIGVVRVAFVSSVLPRLLPALLRAMHAQLPGIELELKDLPSPLQARALLDNSLDFGLVRLPLSLPGLHTRRLFDEGLVVALPSSDPLCAAERIEPAQLVAREVFVLARKFAPCLHDLMLVAFHQGGAQLQWARELGEFTTMLALVASGQGIGLVPAQAAAVLPPGVVVRPLALELPGAGIGVAWGELDTACKRAFFRVLEGVSLQGP
ncbi:LysR substrate-binding domain-containing protein [Pseudomonas sp. dw_358]|uniref:LysR substrate-binding domain-containing protein n=1 Tax=Pseudomonas sp. dw_358 TaxID=2720083 RepID=UPI001BD25F4C|nr:LysR substrate-binding domain-containing protein [Pseudomonas sp. dw_358]